MSATSKIFKFDDIDTISQFVIQALSLSLNDSVTLEVRGNSEIIMRKCTVKNNYPSIKELFSGYTGSVKVQEMQVGESIGRELI